MWKGIIARSVSVEAFPAYVATLRWDAWKPTFLTLHNTAVPSLAQRPNGFSLAHIRGLEDYYKNDKGWLAGPHLFIDDHQIWLFTALTTAGTHSPSWNGSAIGIEMLGDYARESFSSGRGLAVRRNTAVAMAALNRVLGFKADAFRFHVDDPGTTHDCPGRLARAARPNLVSEIQKEMEKQNADARSGRISGSQSLPDAGTVDATRKGGVRAFLQAVMRWFWTH